MNLVFLGPPGAGKGTQAKMLSTRETIAHISTGEMLRAAVAAGTALGSRVKDILDSGQLVPDAVMIDLIRDRVSQSDCKNGFILDGFPRTVPQAEALETLMQSLDGELDGVVLFELSEKAIQARLENRRGAENRADDSADVQRERMLVYQRQTAPLIEYYDEQRQLIRVDASGSVEDVAVALDRVLPG